MRVAAGGVARNVLTQLLGPAVTIRGARVQVGEHGIDRGAWDWSATAENPFFCPDRAAAAVWTEYLDGVRKAGSSVGAVIEVVASGIPAGLGEPIYGKLDSDLAAPLLSINALQGASLDDGRAAGAMRGEDTQHQLRLGHERGGNTGG